MKPGPVNRACSCAISGMPNPVVIVGISGSLRARSSNTELLGAARLAAHDRIALSLFDGLAGLPHFNPDDDAPGAALPPAVMALRRAIASADGVLISSPEYAHGVPGSLKNALDWLVSGPEMVYKPVGLLNASPHSTHAQASLAETLRTMSAELVPGAMRAFALRGRHLDAAGIAADPALRADLDAALDAMAAAVPAYRARTAGLG